MGRRVVALVAAAASVLAAVVVLAFQVHATKETVVPPEAGQAARGGGQEPERAQATKQAGRPVAIAESHARSEPTRPTRQPPAQPAARGASEASESADEPPPRPSLGGTFYPPDLPPRASPAMLEKRRAVTEAYDVGDYEAAFRNAEEFLPLQPDNEYVKRVAAVAACALGDEASARKHYRDMNEGNQRLIEARCSRFGVNF